VKLDDSGRNAISTKASGWVTVLPGAARRRIITMAIVVAVAIACCIMLFAPVGLATTLGLVEFQYA